MTEQRLSAHPAETRPSPASSSRPVLRRLVAVTAVVCVAAAATYVGRSTAGPSCGTAPVAARAVSDLRGYLRWLHRNHARGYVGEVGWPSGGDAGRWRSVAQQWYDEADRAGLWVTAWAAGRWWPRSYRMAVYRLDGRRTAAAAGPQAAVVQAHADTGGALRGVDLPSGAFGSGPESRTGYSNARPGRYGTDYYYDSRGDLDQVAATGAAVVRLSVAWERLQPRLGGPLRVAELRRVRATLRAARNSGLGVVLDLHGYGDYWVAAPHGQHRRLTLGSAALTDADFADFWRRLSTAVRGSTAVVGYGLMNEPTRLAPRPSDGVRMWESASQAAVREIRRTGDQHLLFVSGYGGASPAQWAEYQPRAWIRDPLDLVRYETHQYFDADRSGHYGRSFTEETRRARQAGFRTVCSSTLSARR